MKKSVKSVLFAAAVLTAISSTAVSCGSGDSEKGSNDSTNINVPDTSKVAHEGFAPTTNIRYVDIDSIVSGYEYAKQEMSKLESKSLELQQYQNTLAAQVQKKANEIKQKVDNNIYLSQQSYESDMQEYQQMVQNADANYAKRAQALSIEMAQVQETIFKAIENYITRYNQEKKYDAILLRSSGVYFNPALDITDDVIKGLNEQTPVVADDQKTTEKGDK